MNTIARMKKFVVDNRVDKEGFPEPIIQLQVEMRFHENLAVALASMTNGKQIALSIEPMQPELSLGENKRT